MDLLQVIVELRHHEPLKLFRPYEELFRSLTGKELPEKEGALPLPGFELNIGEKKMRVVVDPGRTAVVLGYVPNVGYCVDNVMATFNKISELIKLPPLIRLGIRSYWIEKANVNFTELVSLYKEILCKPNSIVEQSTDIGVTFTLTENKNTARMAFGPMELSQLKGILLFEPPELPDVVTFLDVDYYSKPEPAEITARMLHAFVNAGLNYAENQSQRLIKILSKE
ncbi:MAG: hypothetical protein OEW82_04760 [Dehalococcoidia bacterium]|nr:hypothetical protein [Dehalococcoidia bacterium]